MQMGHVPDKTDFVATCISQALFIRDLESSLLAALQRAPARLNMEIGFDILKPSL